MKKIFLIIILIIVVMFCTTQNNKGKVNANDIVPSLEIVSYNISYGDSIYLVVAVDDGEVDSNLYNVEMLFWNSLPDSYDVTTADYQTSSKTEMVVKEKECLIFYSNGIAAKEMADEIYMCAYVKIGNDEYYSNVCKYSVVEYVYDRLNNNESTEKQINLYHAMLEYGASAQILFDYNLDRLANSTFLNVSLEEGILEDGFDYGLYPINSEITIKPKQLDSNSIFAYWVDQNGEIVSYEEEYTFTLLESVTYRAVYTHTLDFSLNTKTFEVTHNDNATWYEVASKNSSNLLYIIITITINDSNYQNDLYKLIINGKEINNYTITDNVIVYDLEDPNWSDYI